MPAIVFWSRSTPLSWERPAPVMIASKAAWSKSSASGSGPSDAMPGTSDGSVTTYTARCFCVPASVRSKPESSSSTTRSASGPLPGLGGVVGAS